MVTGLGAAPLLFASDCDAAHDRARKEAEENASRSRSLLNADMLNRRLGTGAYEEELARIRKERDRALAAAREAYDACVKAAKEDDRQRAEGLEREADRLQEQFRGLETRATGRDPAALRSQSEAAKAKAKELRNLASQHQRAGNYEQANALGSQASILESAANNLESAAGWEALKKEEDARKARRDADQRAAAQIDLQTESARRGNLSSPSRTTPGDPTALQAEAQRVRSEARKVQDQNFEAIRNGNVQQGFALARQAQELETRANQLEATARRAQANSSADDLLSRLRSQSGQAVQTGLEDALTGVAEEYGRKVRDGLEEALDVPAVPGRYAGERVREYLESATDHTITVLPLAGTVGNYIAGPMRQDIRGLMDSSRNLPPTRSSGSGGGYAAPGPGSGSRSWAADAPAAEPADPAYEGIVNDAFEDLRQSARLKQQAEQQKLNELLNILKTPAPATSASPPVRRDRFDQPSPSPSPTLPPRRSRFDTTTPTPAPARDFRRFD